MAWYDKAASSTKEWRLGTVKRDVDGREYIYLKGVSSLAANEWVIYDEAFATTRMSTSTTQGGAPVAISIVANASATTYSWFGRVGSFTGVTVDAGGDADNKQVYATGTAGAVTDSADNDATVLNAVYRSNDSSTALTATFQINNPSFFLDLST